MGRNLQCFMSLLILCCATTSELTSHASIEMCYYYYYYYYYKYIYTCYMLQLFIYTYILVAAKFIIFYLCLQICVLPL